MNEGHAGLDPIDSLLEKSKQKPTDFEDYGGLGPVLEKKSTNAE